VYKINLVTDTEVTFVLTSGGHNAGIVSEPGHHGRHFRLASRLPGENYVDPDTWAGATPLAEGSWWPAWTEWLEKRSSGHVAPPPIGAPASGYPALGPAPGRYVLER
jgi:polyhydroxyalkanoate synthase